MFVPKEKHSWKKEGHTTIPGQECACWVEGGEDSQGYLSRETNRGAAGHGAKPRGGDVQGTAVRKG